MPRDEAYLLDIVLAARRAIKYVAKVSRASFETDDMVQDAVARTLEIIGEAAGSVSEEFRETNSEIPWHLMIGMRNRIIHEYSRVNWGTIWDTVKNDLPTLIRSLEALIPPEG
jgi:uncharacterized protein with HEPN domain